MKRSYVFPLESVIEILDTYSQSLALVSAFQLIVRVSIKAKSITNSTSSYPYAVGKFHVDRQLGAITMSKLKVYIFTPSVWVYPVGTLQSNYTLTL